MLNIPTETELPLDELDPSLRPLVREYAGIAAFLAEVGVPYLASSILAETRYQEVLGELSTLIERVNEIDEPPLQPDLVEGKEAVSVRIEYRAVHAALTQLHDTVNQIRSAQARATILAGTAGAPRT